MPALAPISRRELIYYLRRLGWEGPYPGGNHEYMVYGSRKVRIPNPHGSKIGKPLLVRILRQADITTDQWEAL